MPFRLGYTLEFGETEAEAAVLCAVFARCSRGSRATLSAAKALRGGERIIAAVDDRQPRESDDRASPGRRDLRAGNPLIGSDSGLSFQKITGDFSFYRPVTSRITFAERVRGGYVAARRTATPPPQERLYAGGANSVRGFGENELGPLSYLIDFSSFKNAATRDGNDTVALIANPQATAARTVPVGGNALVIFNTELRIRDPFFPGAHRVRPVRRRRAAVDAGAGDEQDQPRSADRDPGTGRPVLLAGGAHSGERGVQSFEVGTHWPGVLGGHGDPLTVNSPLLCVTPPAAPPVPILSTKRQADQDRSATVPASSCHSDRTTSSIVSSSPFRSAHRSSVTRRRLVALVAVTVFVLLGIVGVSTILFVTRTDYGREQLRSRSSRSSRESIKGGQIYIGHLSGNFAHRDHDRHLRDPRQAGRAVRQHRPRSRSPSTSRDIIDSASSSGARRSSIRSCTSFSTRTACGTSRRSFASQNNGAASNRRTPDASQLGRLHRRRLGVRRGMRRFC